MRIWDVSPDRLCRNHLLGEHRELHALWTILTQNKEGYSRHPETVRWRGRLKALFQRHNDLVGEMEKRGYSHRSPLDPSLASGQENQDAYVDCPDDQIRILKGKECSCRV